ncbi:tetratricopeptide repeat protein [Ekhidna sp.]|uniref:tetratricopeptide repeat protein n=1 Tax=Ekhidna sp. TaxID=2608089 RepID=UPI003297F0D3
MRKYLVLIFGISLHLSAAQNSITSDSFSGLSAFESFQARKYQSVIGSLKSKENKSKDEEILLLLSELKTGNGDGERIEKWLSDNPKHPIKPLVSYHIGEYFFYADDTIKSEKYLSGVTATDLTKNDQASFGYVYGLLKLNEANYKSAKNLFQFSRKSGFDQIKKLDYYEGFAAYHLGTRDEALVYFEKVKDSQEFGNSAKFFIAKMKLENKEAEEVIAMTQSELSDEKTLTNSGFHQLIGEAYALKDQAAKADAFFERAIELHPSKPSAALYYQAGVSKFKIGNEDLAIQFLTESGLQGGEYAQLSAFQLGRLFLKKKDYEKALSAYVEASVSKDEVIKEESYFQTASINAKLEQYAQAISYAIDYLSFFKDSPRREAMQNLIAQSYLRTSNYDLAIDHLNKVGELNATQKAVYQKVTYQKAVLSFNDGRFAEADNWFRQSLKHTTDQSLKNSSYYHLAEIAMRNNRYDDAISNYKKQSTLNAITHYGIGYAFYNKQQYMEALPHFRSAGQVSDLSTQNDAKVRLADCLYATKSYQSAFNIYKELSGKLSSPYLTFQKGMALKNMGQGVDAISTFKTLFTDSRYAAQATFQSGMIQFESANFASADSYFSQVVDNHPTSQYLVESLLNRGVSKKNLGDLENAKSDYETILKNHLASDIAINAILGLQELQQAGTEVKNLDQYIDQYKKTNPESGSLEVIEFEAAKRLYFDFSYQKAAKSFEKYLKDYPSSSNKIEAKYYQADSYYRIEELENAKPVFDDLKFIRNPLTGRILNRLGEINKRLDLPKEAEEAYKLLIDLNLSTKDTYNARQGLMLLYFKIKRFSDAIVAADEIISSDWKPLNAEQDAILIKAKSWFQLGNIENARINFELLATGQDANGAESNYYLGQLAYKNGEYKKSLDLLFNLNSNYGSYTQWVDQSYLLIARNYIELNELFQAKATLRSIIQHSNNETIKQESNILLIEIEQNSIQSDSTQIKD